MSPETKDLLRQFDEPGAYEFPSAFDYADLERRAKLVCEDIKRLGVRVGFEGAVYNQDASFSIALLLHSLERGEASTRYLPTVRFSNFGNLATITWSGQIPETVTQAILSSLLLRGFMFLDAEELDCEYDGVMLDKKNTFKTWWIRYFDWI